MVFITVKLILARNVNFLNYLVEVFRDLVWETEEHEDTVIGPSIQANFLTYLKELTINYVLK